MAELENSARKLLRAPYADSHPKLMESTSSQEQRDNLPKGKITRQ